MSEETRFHLTPYLRQQMSQNPPQLAFSATDREGWLTWREALRNQIRNLLDPWPEPIDLASEIVHISDEGDHWREKIILSSHINMEIPCFMLRPKGGDQPGPAILALHGHGDGKSAIVGQAESMPGIGIQMVRAGYLVFTIDFFPFGERRETEGVVIDEFGDSCNSTLIHALLWGYNLLTLNLFDVMRSLDYLEMRPEVDPERIGVMGASYGGTTSMYAAILDRRIKAAVLSCSLGEYCGHGIELAQLCGSQVVPGVLQWAEMGDVVGLLAPSPLLVESARNDECFPWSYTVPTLERLSEVYRIAGAEDRLTVHRYDGDHQYYGDGVVEFWGQYL